ncbi:helix-turn-helix domain-containing protein [Actinomadura rugatobispora]|uniref:LuxR C-terminal-related transcriptional regulator n=1 Tax=Actinomadura rugatobispora TaxID=1994 RepID=A0ABW1A4J8_9ACTN|nr:hypothetical protein GCM10010200_008050 [Actinomadura rugatobispora]
MVRGSRTSRGGGRVPGRDPSRPGPDRLTAREREAFKLVAEGRNNKQIAAALFISPKPASVHVSNILAKLDVTSRTQAAAKGHADGLLTG